jgi:Methyltransferase domain
VRFRDRVTEILVGMQGRSASSRARGRRFEMLVERFPELSEMRVLDLGGEPHTWCQRQVQPREVVLLNLDWQTARQIDEVGEDAAWIRPVAGDACDPPEELRQDHFDLVFSNSVIEHVGGHESRTAFANSARELGTHYWVQTPNRYFPVEPHWVFPGFQFLSEGLRARVMLHWPIGNYASRKWTYEEALNTVREVELLSEKQMRAYFTDATIIRERWAGMTKSLIAAR